ncbi:transmembrane protein [Cyclospora cayetanensis]|uniref:Transmembrane protein n=1 Tax=Cyclospora cayetanensis TaxID=88456 RepID=A0A1D3D1S4_9EIME|nr:transmembrane protein [Cyclospora cayetanensis]
MQRSQGTDSGCGGGRRRGPPQLLQGTLYGGDKFDPVMLFSQLLLLLSSFYVLLSGASFGALTVLQNRQLPRQTEPQSDLLVPDKQEQVQQPEVALPRRKEDLAPTVTPQPLQGRQVLFLFSSGSSETLPETGAALDAALLLTGALLCVPPLPLVRAAVLPPLELRFFGVCPDDLKKAALLRVERLLFRSFCVYRVVQRSRKIPDFCFSLGFLHFFACLVISGFPTRSASASVALLQPAFAAVRRAKPSCSECSLLGGKRLGKDAFPKRT